MKKSTLSFIVYLLGILTLSAQTIVPVVPMNKNVVLEEYTGLNCVYCPDGHRIANLIKASNPTRVNLINIHQGSFATPSTGQPDYRTPWGNALAGQTGLTGYPSGTVNRRVFSGSVTALSRSAWTGAANTILSQASYVNVAATATVDIATRLLTVNVEAYYTANGPAQNNLNVALMQNNVIGPQTGGATYNPGYVVPPNLYRHMHMLRHLLTGQWGDEITKTSAGTFVSRAYTYTLPAHINNIELSLGNLEVVVFIAEVQQNIITGNEAQLTYINFPFLRDASIGLREVPAEICLGKILPKITLRNEGSHEITSIDLTYTVNGNPAQNHKWTGSLPMFASVDVTLPELALTTSPTYNLQVNITKVNNLDDPNPANNSATANIPHTTRTSAGKTHTLKFRQDRYGSETTWRLVQSATGQVIASGGPFANLAANGILEHTYNLTLPSGGCYAMQVFDSYGDGMNTGFGAGGYTLLDENGNIITFNGIFQFEDTKLFTLLSVTGIGNPTPQSVHTYPNPAGNLVYFRNTNGYHTIHIFSAIGQMAKIVENFDGNEGQHGIDVSDLANGVYFVKLTGVNRETITKLVISR